METEEGRREYGVVSRIETLRFKVMRSNRQISLDVDKNC